MLLNLKNPYQPFRSIRIETINRIFIALLVLILLTCVFHTLISTTGAIKEEIKTQSKTLEEIRKKMKDDQAWQHVNQNLQLSNNLNEW